MSDRWTWTAECTQCAHSSCDAGRVAPVLREFESRVNNHEELMATGDLAQNLGRIWTTTILPRPHWRAFLRDGGFRESRNSEFAGTRSAARAAESAG
jgi:hypothetical protein